MRSTKELVTISSQLGREETARRSEERVQIRHEVNRMIMRRDQVVAEGVAGMAQMGRVAAHSTMLGNQIAAERVTGMAQIGREAAHSTAVARSLRR
jgi:hypothetical protein